MEDLFGGKQMEEVKPKREEFHPRMVGGYEFDEVTSSLQKSIRRGKERDAIFWAAILFKSGFSGYLKRRLPIIINEDVGVANPQALVIAGIMSIEAKAKMRDPKYEKQEFSGDGFLPVVNLILIACRGKKTRMGDELVNLIMDGIEKWGELKEVPEYAVDPHTKKGREKYGYWESGTKEESQTRIKNWFDNWAKLENEASEEELPNPYKKELMEKWGYSDVSKAPVKEDRTYVHMNKANERK
jgi:replication-associated recombination protein RarA